MEQFLDVSFWVAVGQIIMLDILLGGDNAIVIALACRKLPPELRTKGIVWGTVGAILLRVILIFFALQLLTLPYLKLIGAALLIWIGIKLMTDEDEEHEINASDRLLGAIKTIIVADLVMSIDNVIGISAAANGASAAHQMPLVIFGLLVSIPIIVFGSQFVLRAMERFPWIVTIGGLLLGWVAGTLAAGDVALLQHLDLSAASNALKYGLGVAGALLVWVVAKYIKRSTSKP